MSILFLGLLSLGIIILVHEFGHLIFARLFSVTVHEFSIGIGPKIFSKKVGTTEYSIRVLPLGGFCKMESIDLDALAQLSPADKIRPVQYRPNSLYSVSYIKKIAILSGGVILNLGFFFLLYCLLFLFSYREEQLPPRIDPIENGPAAQINMQTGDRITMINTTAVRSFDEVRNALAGKENQQVSIHFERNQQKFQQNVFLNSEPPLLGIRPFISPYIEFVDPKKKASLADVQAGDTLLAINGEKIYNALDYFLILNSLTQSILSMELERENGTQYSVRIEVETQPIVELGIMFERYMIKKWDGIPDFLSSVASTAFTTLQATFSILTELLTFRTDTIMQNASGPIRLVTVIGQSTLDSFSEGISSALLHFIRITALISLAVGAFNLLPIPVLDGGHMLFHTFYLILRKTPSYRAITYFNNLGVLLLLALFLLVLINDITFLVQ